MNKLPNVLFLLIDALRADQCYGNKTKTPTIDSLIENGVYFKQAIASNDGTFLSLNSLFSGKFSFRTENRAQKIILAKNNFLEILKTNGYHIYGLIPNLTSFNPLSKSFENNENMYEHGPPTEVLSKGLGQKIIEFLNSKKMIEPWFYYVHISDLHPFREGVYEEVVQTVDTWLDKILKNVNSSETLTILTADHGERIPFDGIRDVDFEPEFNSLVKFGKTNLPKFSHKTGGRLLNKVRKSISNYKKENANKILSSYEKRSREPNHKLSLYDEILRIPLIFSGYRLPPKIIDKQVCLIDTFPTICDLCKLNNDVKTDGRSLVPAMEEKNLEEKPIYLHTIPYVKVSPYDRVGLRTGKYKYFRNSDDSKKDVHLYDLDIDPKENNNITKQNPDIINKFEKILFSIQNYGEQDTIEEIPADELHKIEEELKKSGYI